MKKLDSTAICNNCYTLFQLTKRDMKIFLKDKASVFFSLLAPLIILLLYILFLGDIQVSSVKSFFPEGMPIDEKAIKAYVDSWMLAGVLSVACITVSFSANNVMVQDKTLGILNDSLSSPVSKTVIKLSYFLFNFVVTAVIVLVVFIICMIYLAITGGWYLSVAEVFALIGNILYSSLSATLISVFVCGFLKSEAQLGGLTGIMSAVLGFLIGAYMPMSIMPKAAQYISALIPGSHSAGVFRTLFMTGSLNNLASGLPQPAVDEIANAFAMNMDFFGKTIKIGFMLAYMAAFIVIFFVLNMIVELNRKKK